ncbi:hypothetical protein [Actinoplanes rectilineatus]|uniref:hypothetical protein n=1 Tax=Actinoplanes rectilineatus TaxID=113571 RepID=UPI000A6DC04E|nr:hypothetical protein [Actinoplanes rectilineatus]
MPALLIDFRHAPGAWAFKMTAPRLLVDGVEHPVSGWGPRNVNLGPGTHRVEVFVPYVLPRKAGRVTRDVVLPDEGLQLEYMAPTITFAKGKLGPRGEQVSTGYRPLQIFNVIFLVFAVIYLAARYAS